MITEQIYCKICCNTELIICDHTAKCKKCGTLLYYPYPDESVLNIHHDEISINKYKSMHRKWYKMSSVLNHDNLTRMFKFVINHPENTKANIKILDYGAGCGQFALICKSFLPECSVYAVDINDYSLLDEYRALNIQMPFSEFEQANTKFDLIFLNDVFEHVSDPVRILELLSSKLVPNGKIFIDTPKQFWIYPVLRSINKNLYKKLLKGTVSKAHLQIWTKKSFNIATMKAGVKIIKYKELSEYTLKPDFYLDNMGIKSYFIRFIGKLFYSCSGLLAKNKIMAVLTK